MATYRSDIYGLSKYGPSQQAEFSTGPGGFYSEPTASGSEIGALTIRWNPVGGTFTAFRLVRNFLNIPGDQEDGEELTTVNSGEHIDRGLPQGSFVYYSIFVQDATGEWFRAGDLIALVTRDWGYGDRLWDLLPDFYKVRDEGLVSLRDPDPLRRSEEGPLRRFLRLIGHEFNVIRTEYETMRLVSDPGSVSGGLLPVLAEQIGLTYETELGMRRNRAYIENAVHFFKLKGTRPGVEGIVTAVTGWDADVSIGRNIMLDTRDSSFVLGSPRVLVPPFGTWQHTSGGLAFALTDEATEGFTSALSGFDTSFLKITGTGPDTPTNGVITSGLLPIQGRTSLSASVYRRDTTYRLPHTHQMRFQYFNSQRQFISDLASTSYPPNGGWIREIINSAPVPANTFFVKLLIEISERTGDTTYLDFVQVEDPTGLPVSLYEHARTIYIKLHPDRINKVQNPSLENGTFAWSHLTNCQPLARTTAIAKSGSASGLATSVAAGAMEWGTGLMPVSAGLRYAASVYLNPVGPVQTVSASIVWVAADSSIISVVQSPEEPEVSGQWVRPGAVGTAPAAATHAYLLVRIHSTAAGEQHRWDAALFEKAESVKTYFDASLVSSTSDYLWENGLAAHTAPSYFYAKRTVKRARLLQVLAEYLPAASSPVLEFAKNP